jgi:hypothetical protein
MYRMTSLEKNIVFLFLNSILHTVENRVDGSMILHYFNYLNHLYSIHLFDQYVYHQFKILFELVIEQL